MACGGQWPDYQSILQSGLIIGPLSSLPFSALAPGGGWRGWRIGCWMFVHNYTAIASEPPGDSPGASRRGRFRVASLQGPAGDHVNTGFGVLCKSYAGIM